jgi:hypothetical protein
MKSQTGQFGVEILQSNRDDSGDPFFLNRGPTIMDTDSRLRDLGIDLDAEYSFPADDVAAPVVVSGRWAFTSGIYPLARDGTPIVGRVGRDLSLEDAKVAARQTAVTVLATLRKHLGSLNRVRRIAQSSASDRSSASIRELH